MTPITPDPAGRDGHERDAGPAPTGMAPASSPQVARSPQPTQSPQPTSTAPAPVWRPPVGDVEGFREAAGEAGPGVEVLRAVGVPYARAERFAAPQPVRRLPGDAPFRATEPGRTCPQRPMAPSHLISPHARPREHGEDCQHVAITVPDGTGPEDRLPVMVWIHGGSNVSGGGDLPRFNPSQLAAEQGVIVVSVTYRLGAYGFVYGPDGELPDGNYGLQDIREALEWIRGNIAAFGGDPGCVTLFGQSAGADLILNVMVAAGAEKLADGTPPPFRRVILQSLPFGFRIDRSRMYAAMMAAGGPIARDAAEADIAAVEDRATAVAREFKSGQGMPFGVRDGLDPLPDADRAGACLAAIAPDVDVLAGHTPREGSLFFNTLPEGVRLQRIPLIGGAVYEAAMRVVTKATYGGSRKFTRTWAANGGRALHYTLDWGAADSRYRSAHTCDLPLLLGDRESWRDSVLIEGRDWADVAADRRAAQAVWASFAKTGDVAGTAADDASSFLAITDVTR